MRILKVRKSRRCLLLVLMMLFTAVPMAQAAAIPEPPVLAAGEDAGHGSGCRHTHSSSCYSYGSHSYPSCYGGHATNTAQVGTHFCSKCGNEYKNYLTMCKKCAASTSFGTACGCGENAAFNEGALTDICSRNLTCTSSHSTLTCSKGTYYDCVKPTLASVDGPAGWVKEAYTPVLNGSNIAQVQVNNGVWTTPAACQISESGTYPIQVKSSSGHVIAYSLTVNNIDQIAPEAPSYSLLDIIKAKLGK